MEMNNDILPLTCPSLNLLVLRMRPFLPLPKMKSPLRLPRPTADAKRMPRC